MRSKFALLRDEQGSAVVEFAIVLALVLVSAWTAMTLVGTESERSLAALSNWELSEQPGAAKKSRAADNAESGQSNLSSDVNLIGDKPAGATLHQHVLTAVLAGLAILCYVTIRRYRAVKHRALEKLDDTRDLVERLDNKRYLKRQEILKVLAADPNALMMNRIEVRQLMSTRLRTVRPKTTLDEMRSIMAHEHVRHFPVVNEKGRLMGIVSDRDLMNQVAQKASDVMTSSLITVSPTSKLGSALAQMISRNISCLPVTDGDTLIGILTTTDAVLTLQCVLQLWQRNGTTKTAQAQPAMA